MKSFTFILQERVTSGKRTPRSCHNALWTSEYALSVVICQTPSTINTTCTRKGIEAPIVPVANLKGTSQRFDHRVAMGPNQGA